MGSALVLVRGGVPGVRMLLPLTTLLLIFAFPFVVLALASHRQAAEARISKAIRARFE
jgi:hypothetical protein